MDVETLHLIYLWYILPNIYMAYAYIYHVVSSARPDISELSCSEALLVHEFDIRVT